MTLKLGRIHDFQPPRIADLAAYATTPLPAPAPFLWAPVLAGNYPAPWQVADNDRLGCCVLAGAMNDNVAWSAIANEPWIYPGDAAVEKEYFSLTGGQDTGLVISQFLETWRTTGIFGQTIPAYAPVHVANTTAIKQAVEWFGSCRIGVNLPAAAETQFNAPTPSSAMPWWTLTGTPADDDILGGHNVEIVGFDPQGVILVTWGKLVNATWAWIARYTEEAWVVIPPEFVKRGGDARGINLAQLQADLESM